MATPREGEFRTPGLPGGGGGGKVKVAGLGGVFLDMSNSQKVVTRILDKR